MKNKDPLIQGGQGHSAEEINASALAITACFIIGIIVLLIAALT